MEEKDVILAISELYGFKLIEDNEKEATFQTLLDKDLNLDKKAKLDKNHLKQIFRKLKKFHSNEDVELFNNKSYEVLVRSENRIYFPMETIKKEDSVNKLSYSLSRPSDEYLVFFLHNLYKNDVSHSLRNRLNPHRLRRLYTNRDNTQIELFEESVFEVIKTTTMRFETIRITSKEPKELIDFESLLYAFTFNLGFNLDYTILPLRFIDEFIQPYRLGKIRRANYEDVEPPKRKYTNELILHYQKGISSESIDHQYLSFYHVIEHYFEKIYSDDILARVKNELTKPSFSYKRQKDIGGLISIIQSRLKYKNEEFQINELEALELTLRKFIPDLSELIKSLNKFSIKLIDYYKSNEVSFSGGNKVNLKSSNEDEIYKNLAKRIYLTRNCIVHSKEAQKVKFTPFKDDKNLLSEIYLLRLIAEFVIINDSLEL